MGLPEWPAVPQRSAGRLLYGKSSSSYGHGVTLAELVSRTTSKSRIGSIWLVLCLCKFLVRS